MSTTRIGFANALLSAIAAPHTADALHVLIAQMMVEGQSAGENDPLASLNERDAHGEGGAGNRFSFAHIDNALAVSARQLNKGGPYATLGDVYRSGAKAPALIDAIGRAGWAGGPRNPSPTYAPAIRSRYNSIQDQAAYAREATKVVGTTDITGAPTHYSTNDGITGGDVVASAGDVVGGAVGGVVDAASAVGTLAQHLLDVDFWKRAGVFALGGALMLWGLALLGHGIAPNVAAGVKRAASAIPIV